MPSAWKTEPLPPPNGFEDFIECYDAWEAGKTSDPVRLKARIDRIWSNLSIVQKKAYSAQMVNMGKLDEIVLATLKKFGGHINQWEAHRWKRSL